MPKPDSLRAYARRRGVSHPAVVRAVAAGRLSQSVGRDDKGRPFITDVALADQEWVRNAAKPAKGVDADPVEPPGAIPREHLSLFEIAGLIVLVHMPDATADDWECAIPMSKETAAAVTIQLYELLTQNGGAG